MGLFNDFKDGVGTTGKGLGMVLGGTAKLAGTVGKAAFKGVKVVAKGAIDMMLSSSENSVLDYCYEDYEGDLDLRAHKVLSQALVDLTMRRPWDSYLWCILSHCENLCLSDKSGQLLDDKKFRSICRGMLSDDKSAKEKIEKQFDEFFQKHNEYNEDDMFYNPFACVSGERVGDIWERERDRYNALKKERNIDTIVVWERDYNSNKEKVHEYILNETERILKTKNYG